MFVEFGKVCWQIHADLETALTKEYGNFLSMTKRPIMFAELKKLPYIFM